MHGRVVGSALNLNGFNLRGKSSLIWRPLMRHESSKGRFVSERLLARYDSNNICIVALRGLVITTEPKHGCVLLIPCRYGWA